MKTFKELREKCWPGHRKVGTQPGTGKNKGKRVDDCEKIGENFQDGRNPQDKGDMARHGLKGKSITQLKKVRSSSSATPREKQLAHWRINMSLGKKKDK